jgi:hypothetical protein
MSKAPQSGGPLPDVMGTLVPMFEKTAGNKMKISFKGGPAVAADVKQGLRTSSSPTPRLSTSLPQPAMWPAAVPGTSGY